MTMPAVLLASFVLTVAIGFPTLVLVVLIDSFETTLKRRRK